MRNTKVTVKRRKGSLPFVSRLKIAGGNFKAKALFHISFLALENDPFDDDES